MPYQNQNSNNSHSVRNTDQNAEDDIPGLDGGHIFFTLVEIVTRRTPSEKFLTVAQNVGMFLLIALMILANGNDILRWLGFM